MQNDVSISTNEKDLNVVYGMINFGEERELARASLKYILSDMCDIKKSYVRLGFHLWEFSKMKYYYDFGYASLEEFSDVNLGLDKSAVSRCINVFCRFAVKDGFNYKMFLQDRYKEYSYSQLCEMLSMDDETIRKVKPEMTIKQIRELKKSKRNVSQGKDNVSQVATSQPGNYLCVSDLCNKRGIVLQNCIKNCDSLGFIDIKIFDVNGKIIHLFSNCDILMKGSLSNNHSDLVLRLRD